MAGILRQTFRTISSKALKSCANVSVVGTQNIKLSSEIATRGLTLTTVSRSLHCKAASSSALTKLTEQSKLCGCRKYHTKGDENLAEFLEQEISQEKENPPPKDTSLSGWSTNTDGTVVKLTKSFKEESITVEFDVTSGVEGDLDEQIYDAEAPEDSQMMISRPPFNVEIKKSSGNCLKIACEFTPPEPQFDEGQEQKDENIEDQFSIIEVSLSEPGQTENYFTLSGGIMDEVMYDLLMEMLDERGIDDDFVTNLVKYSTSYEQSMYIKFLQSLKNFVAEK